MSLNRVLSTFLRRHGRLVRYRSGGRLAVTRAWITSCGELPEALSADLTGLTAENRFVYLSAASFEPPAVGSIVDCGGEAYKVEQSGSVSADGLFCYVWALLVREEAAVWSD